MVQAMSGTVQLHRSALKKNNHKVLMDDLHEKILFLVFFFLACDILYLCNRASGLGRRNEGRGLWHGEWPHCCQSATVLWQSGERGVAALRERCGGQEQRIRGCF